MAYKEAIIMSASIATAGMKAGNVSSLPAYAPQYSSAAKMNAGTATAGMKAGGISSPPMYAPQYSSAAKIAKVIGRRG